jgi:Ca2+-binding RTX toxin-like protein
MAATMVGTVGIDRLLGTNGDDVIYGLAGKNSIDGLAGNDSLVGGVGNDTVNGGYGNDSIFGGPGGDKLYDGSLGDDYIQSNGDGTRANVFCGDGFDRVVAGPEDVVEGKLAKETNSGHRHRDCERVFVR